MDQPPDIDLHFAAQQLLAAIQNKHWGLVVSLVLVGIVWCVRAWGRKVPKFGPVLDHPVVAWLLPSLSSVLGALVTSLVAGNPITVGLIVTAIITGLTANGLFNGAKQLAEAKAQGKAAAAEVKTKADAIEVLKKGPNP